MRVKVSGEETKKLASRLSKSEEGILAGKIKRTVRKKLNRQEMIATAAYFRAEKRGFQSSEADVLQDWLQAEIEIDNILGAPAGSGKNLRLIKNKLIQQ